VGVSSALILSWNSFWNPFLKNPGKFWKIQENSGKSKKIPGRSWKFQEENFFK
jgi:hypothetical protein